MTQLFLFLIMALTVRVVSKKAIKELLDDKGNY